MRQDAKCQDQPTLWDQGHDSGPGEERKSPSTPPPPSLAPPSSRTPPVLPDKRPTVPMDQGELWNIDDVANYLGVPKQTIYAWRTTGYGPPGFRVGKHLRWRSSTVITWTLDLEQEK